MLFEEKRPIYQITYYDDGDGEMSILGILGGGGGNPDGAVSVYLEREKVVVLLGARTCHVAQRYGLE